jgi:hypothetical protein
MTTDAGETWISIDGDLPDLPANCVAAHRIGSATSLYVGTDAGVYRTCNAGQSWRKIIGALPNTPVIDLAIDPTGGRLVAATMGRGIWQTTLPSDGDDDDDGDLDLRDIGVLFSCFSGATDQPGFTTPSRGCQNVFDFDLDSDIDGRDMPCLIARLGN